MIKAFKHKDTGRYLATISRKYKEVETTKMIDDAIKWDFSIQYRQYQFHQYLVNHREQLVDFVVVEL